jgi:biopolymer transport protein ExbD
VSAFILSVTASKIPIVVSMNAAGGTFIGDNPVASDDLKTQLAALAHNDPSRMVYVRCDRAIEYGRVIDLVGLVYSLGFANTSLLVEAAKPN